MGSESSWQQPLLELSDPYTTVLPNHAINPTAMSLSSNTYDDDLTEECKDQQKSRLI